MIQFSTVCEKVQIVRVPETWDFDSLGLVGHLPYKTEKFSVRIIGATVAIERGRGDRLIFAEAKDVENWKVVDGGFEQVKPGRSMPLIDTSHEYFGYSARPQCAKIYVPYTYLGGIDITVGGDSCLLIDFASSSDFTVHALDRATVELGAVHCSGKLTLRRSHEATINAHLLTARSMDIEDASGASITKAIVTAGKLDVEDCPMELRYPDGQPYRYAFKGK